MLKIRKISYVDIIEFVGILFVLSIPMMPIFTKMGYMLLGFLSAFLLISYYIRNRKLFFTNFELMQIVFTGLMLISTLYAPKFSASWGHIMGNIRNIFFCFIAVRCFDLKEKVGKKKEQRAVFKYFDIFTLGTILISIYTLIVEPSNNGYYVRLGRIVFDGEYGTYMMYSFNLIIAFGWAIYRFFNANTKKRKVIIFLVLIFMFYCGLLSGTKKCIIAMLLFIFIYIVIKNKKNIVKLISIGTISIMMLVGIYYIVMNNETLYLSIGRRFESFFNYFSDEGEVDASTLRRASFRKMGLEYFWEHPLLGNGIASFKSLYNRDFGIYLYSHNNFIEILCNLGIIGFIIYYGWQLYTFIQLKKSTKVLDVNNLNILFMIFMLIFLVLDYGTVSYDKIQYLITYNVIDYSIKKKKIKEREENEKKIEEYNNKIINDITA